MRPRRIALLLVTAACANPPPVGTRASTAAAAASTAPPPECSAARALRAEAQQLDTGGHAALALAKIGEANRMCPTEQAASAEIEKKLRALLANDAPSKGTEATMRAKMHQAYAAERAKDWAKAEALYLEAWAEHHPSPRALEDAARMAAGAGEAAESRRLRDRALAEAEASEHATARVGAAVQLDRGSARLAGTVLTLASGGKVIARDAATGELRVLLDAKVKNLTLSPWGTLALSYSDPFNPGALSVYDVLTGAHLFTAPKMTKAVVSPDDTAVLVRDYDPDNDKKTARLYDAATGKLEKVISASWLAGDVSVVGFGPDAAHFLLIEDVPNGVPLIRQLDLEKGGYGGVRLPEGAPSPMLPGPTGLSPDGRDLVYIDASGTDAAALHVDDLVTNKAITQWVAHFHSVDNLTLSPDAKTVATGSESSLRLWDVAEHKQLFKREGSFAGTYAEAFSDDSKALLVNTAKGLFAWDVATGEDRPLVPDATPKNILHVVKAPDGVALVLEDEVRLVPSSGEPRTVCKGLPQPSWATPPMIGPTSVAFSPSGKLMACAMWDGWVHVLDTSSWTEKSIIKRGAGSPIDRPVDLVFSADDATLTDVSNAGFVVYDVTTGKAKSRVALRHGATGWMPRHARFDDGTLAVRAYNGAAALFAADGTWRRDVKLVPSAPAKALDAFASNGKTYAVALGKTLHVVDLGSGDDKTIALPASTKSLAVSGDGKTVLVAGDGGAVTVVTDGVAAPMPQAKGVRVGFAGRSLLVWPDKATVEAYASSSDTAPVVLEVDAHGLVARDAAGAFETRGKPEVVCVVGSTYLSRITCDDRAKEGLVASWLARVR